MISAWLRARIGPVPGLAILVTLATAPTTAGQAGVTLALAAAIILALRMRDDVASAARDRQARPERISARPEAARPLNLAAATLLLLAAAALALTGRALAAAALAGLGAALELLYARRPAAAGPTDLLVMLKYPALALLLATPAQWALAGLLGLGLLRFELADDPALAPSWPAAAPLLIAEATLLLTLLPAALAAGLALAAVIVDRLPRRPARAITVITGLELLAPTLA